MSPRTRPHPELETLAYAFVVQMQGSWTEEALDTWRRQLTRQGHTPAPSALHTLLTQARQRYETGAAHLFLCTGRPCQQRQQFETSETALSELAIAPHLTLSTTECQGPCKQAPVATLRVGARCAMLAQFSRTDDWQAVLDFAGRAAAAGTLLVDQGTAEPFQFDPVHEHEHTSVQLRSLRYLLGHFEGPGLYAEDGGTFYKEMLGGWEAGGRCLALRMGVTYPLPDGRKDIHHAFVVLSVNPQTAGLEARAYSDGGEINDFALTLEGETITFTERPATLHGARHGRKIIRPTADGFEERLELDHGDGHYTTHYTVSMRRVTPGA
ncbi:MAG: (2Fe-2S) ferredoxin domain-containing protein [Candidatus Tectimicrobiota bacterium]